MNKSVITDKSGCAPVQTTGTDNTQLSLLPFYPVIEKTKSPRKKTKASYTVSESFFKLCEIQEMALTQSPKPDFTAALRSEELKGKLFSLYSEKKDPEKSLGTLPQVLVEFIDRQVQNQLSETITGIDEKKTSVNLDTSTTDDTIEFV